MGMQRPASDEYAGYFATYVEKVTGNEGMAILKRQLDEATAFIQGLSEEKATYRYAPGKWSVKEVIGHIADTERVMAYRLLCIARGEQAALPGFDEAVYTQNAGFDERTLADLLDDWRSVRMATIHLAAGLPEQAWIRRGNANNSPLTARAVAYILVGHTQHHLDLLKERYLTE